MLKPLRVVAALVLFASVAAAFLAPLVAAALCLDSVPDLSWAAKIQFLPALFALNLPVLVGLVIVTVLVGRVYCSTVCPLGVFQDVLIRLRRLFSRGGRGVSVVPKRSRLRWIVLASVLLSPVLGGVMGLLAFLDPYSAFGRFATHLGRPLLQLLINLVASWGEVHDIYWFIGGDVVWPSLVVLGVTVFSLLAIVVLALRKGRWYCNHLCPVGSSLALLSRKAVFRLKINPELCVGCGQCARVCKAEAIDVAAKRIDAANCVSCFNCLGACRKGAIGK